MFLLKNFICLDYLIVKLYYTKNIISEFTGDWMIGAGGIEIDTGVDGVNSEFTEKLNFYEF